MAKIWFGNSYRAEYVAAPVTGLDASGVGSVSSVQLQNGGAFVTGSTASHREFPMSWSVKSVAELQFLSAYFSGIYGNEYLYWVDPFAANVLPPHWAAPTLACGDWPSIIAPGQKPVAVSTPANTLGLPKFGAVYAPGGKIDTIPDRQLTLLIPRDSFLHIGFLGEAEGATVRIQPVRHDDSLGPVRDAAVVPVRANPPYALAFAGSDYKLVRIYITPTRVGGTVTLYAGQAVYSKSLIPPFTQPFAPGTGHTGMMFSGVPTTTYVQAIGGRKLVSAAASFTEVEAWQ